MDRKRVHANAVNIGNASTFYVQMNGGSIVPFLLLGPIGTAISAESIKNRTQAQAAAVDKSKIVDPREILANVLSHRPSPPAEETPSAPIVVNPFVVYVRPKGSDSVDRRLVLEIECDKWIGWYTDHFTAIPSQDLNQPSSDDDLAKFSNDLDVAAGDLLDLFEADISAPPSDIRSVQIQSWQLNPYFSSAFPQGLRGTFKGRQVVAGQGDVRKDQWLFVFMKGVHLMDPARIKIGDPW